MKSADAQLALIKRGAVEIIQEKELKAKLEKSIKAKKPLVIKAGFDPTAPDIHLGHTVLLRKLRHFQDLGHDVVFLIGDYTAMIGDPSGVSKTRPRLTKKEVLKNAETYKKQIAKVLDINKLAVRFNSEWLAKMRGPDIAELVSKYSVTRMLERDDFSKRYKEQKPISMLEFFYPLLQGYDSVALKADVELGGTDQKFNMLVGRTIQERYGQKPQVVITMPLLEGLDGVDKMSKSLGNYVGINEQPKDIYGKLMSISDELMYKYYELLTDEDVDIIRKDIASGKLHPKKAKSNLAKNIVTQYYGKKQAEKEEKDFERVFKQKGSPEDMPEIVISQDEINIIDLLMEVKLCESRGEAKRLVQQGGITVNKERIKDAKQRIKITKETKELRAGRLRFAKVYKK
jgi:tyrosyl-tRNA synthetase